MKLAFWTDAALGALKYAADAAREAGIRVWIDVAFDVIPSEHPIIDRHPALFSLDRFAADWPIDPRKPLTLEGGALPRFDHVGIGILIDEWVISIKQLIEIGIGGFLFRRPSGVLAQILQRIILAIRAASPEIVIAVDLAGSPWDTIEKLQICGFDYCLSSLPWWDGKASWFVEENTMFSDIAPVIAQAGAANSMSSKLELAARIRLAAVTGAGWILPFSLIDGDRDHLAQLAKETNHLLESEPLLRKPARLRSLTGSGASITAIVRSDREDRSMADGALVALVNAGGARAVVPQAAILSRIDTDMAVDVSIGGNDVPTTLEPGEVRIIKLKLAKPVGPPLYPAPSDLDAIASAPRIIIQAINPDAHIYSAKSTVNEDVVVRADIFTDGHEQLAAELLFKADDEENWARARMVHEGNDRWIAALSPTRVGHHSFMIEAWFDIWGGFVRDFTKKRDAGVALDLDISEAIALIQKAAAQTVGPIAAKLLSMVERIEASAGDERADLLLSTDLRQYMRDGDSRAFRVGSPLQKLQVERLAARFGSWYELFPRSVTNDPNRPGRLLDVIDRLPAIRKMGFDVLYFPPIHPIGEKNRKGPNNSLISKVGDPGSPYAIGSAAGGHDAIHPDLGTAEDFQRLIAAARAQNLEIALDFAIQCSPDHPWLKQHPEWFAWRADGSMKYAENPPKKYEDIVNVDFYAPAAIPDLWVALRDVVLFWVSQGIRIFRVDNPHTKPFPFWEWMIRQVRGDHPDVIFLAEAFTRPKVMYHLAKIGFSQSYTYFIWRNTKAELTEYLTELNASPACDFFRPHFFVNTPDINPYFLQQSGRAGFLIRAALAATLSGLWGMYSGFELCEFEPLPGKEEYKDSEKYEIRPRDWEQPGNIVAEITRLNQIRKAEPALQSHLRTTFYNAFDDQVLYYGKDAAGQSDKILVAVSLDPHNPRECSFEAPLWEWGLPDDAEIDVLDLLSGAHFIWRGKIQHIRLTPLAPYAIWRVQPRSDV